MAKTIVFSITDHGIDGRDKEYYVWSGTNESLRDRIFDESKNKSWYSKKEEIVDLNKRQSETLSKLNAIDRLALGIGQKEVK